MSTELADLMAELEEAERFEQELQRYTNSVPSSKYQPHDHGQLQFHLADHMHRWLYPGNGFGKTRAMAEEFNAYCTHSNRWKRTPKWPVICIWWAQQYDQFELLKPQIEEETIGDQAVWIESKHHYLYPDGSKWYVLSCDRKWTSIQGINPDLVGYDEQPKLSIFREMEMRRRGKRKTRYIGAATATQGMSWMFDEVYKPWKERHDSLSVSEDQALLMQAHSKFWVWPKGGIDDNPGADEDDKHHYHTTTWTSEKEKRVRLYGGFEDWTGDPIFNAEAVERLRDRLIEHKERRSLLQSGMLVAGTKGRKPKK